MQLSIEVLPAPFGPMMARISPLRMSNGHSVIAFTPPKRERHVLDREQRVALGQRSGAGRALSFRRLQTSVRLLQPG